MRANIAVTRPLRANKAVAWGWLVLMASCSWLFSMGPPTSEETSPRVLGTGDVVQLTVWDEPELSIAAQVSEEGTVVFPLIGPVRAAGLTPLELGQAVKKQYSDGYLVHPQVNVTIVERRAHSVYVLGAVKKPGVYRLKAKTTLLELLARCGGVAGNASDDIVILRLGTGKASAEVPKNSPGRNGGKRDDKRQAGRYTQQLKVSHSMLLSGDFTDNLVLEDRDVILFSPSRQSKEQVYILGDIEKRGAYPLEDNTTLARLLASVGLNPQDEKCTVTLVRLTSGEMQRRTFKVRDVFQRNGVTGLSLQDGDILTVERTLETYYVIGQVSSPGAFRFQKGLTVREAIIMAGWITSRGNLKKIHVMRKRGAEWKTESARLSDEVRPGDVIKVEERWF